MKVELINKDLTFDEPIKYYSFIQYEKSYSDIPKLVVHVPLYGNDSAAKYIDKYILIKDDEILDREIMFEIIDFSITDSEEDEDDKIIITAEGIKRWLGYRIIEPKKIYSGYTNDIIRQIFYDLFLEPLEIKRKVDFLILGADNIKHETGQVEVELHKTSALVEIKKLADLNEIGFDIYPIIETVQDENGKIKRISKLEFIIYTGENKTLDKENKVVLSVEIKNLRQVEFNLDLSVMKTTAFVYGEELKDELGELTGEQYLKIITDDVTGIDRREIIKEAKQIKKEEEMTQQEYDLILETLGLETLSLNRQTETISTTINQDSTIYKIKQDYNIGDMVTAKVEKINRRLDARITKIIVTEDDGERLIDVGLGYPKILELKKIKLEGSV